MSETSLHSQNPDAVREYQTGLDQKNKGQNDGALTSFRRAVIADPNFTEAHLQIGWICKEKAKRDRMFTRYSFEAFRTVARLDPNNQQAHDQYVLAAQESGRLEDLHAEYEALAKQNPSNEIFQRCYKNIVTLSMAMIPQSVNVGDAKASSTMRRFTLLVSLGLILGGLALVFAPAMFRKSGQVGASHMGGLMKAGMALIVFGFAGIFGFTRMK